MTRVPWAYYGYSDILILECVDSASFDQSISLTTQLICLTASAWQRNLVIDDFIFFYVRGLLFTFSVSVVISPRPNPLRRKCIRLLVCIDKRRCRKLFCKRQSVLATMIQFSFLCSHLTHGCTVVNTLISCVCLSDQHTGSLDPR